MRWLSILLLIKLMLVASAQDSFAKTDRLTILDNIDLPGGDYRSIKDGSLQSCRNVCLKEKRCRAYTYNLRAKVCFLKDKISKRAQFKGASSGIKYTHDVMATAQNTSPSTKSIVDSWYKANELCRGESGDKPLTWAWCEVREAIGFVLELRNWCHGLEGQGGAQMVWHKCEATSLHIKIPKSVSSLGRE
jgi:hypothetical protein